MSASASADDEFDFDQFSDKKQQTTANTAKSSIQHLTTKANMKPSSPHFDSAASSIDSLDSPQQTQQRTAQPAVTEQHNETEEDEEEDVEETGDVKTYNAADYAHLKISNEIKDLFAYIQRYTPIDLTQQLPTTLKPFIPDYIPAIGEMDTFIKIAPPKFDEKGQTLTVEDVSHGKKSNKSKHMQMLNLNLLGLTVLDEPSAHQSDPTVLELQLRQTSKQSTTKPMTVHRIEHADANPKKLAKFIASIEEVHKTKSQPVVHYTKPQPSIDQLMQVWPQEFENALKAMQLPSASLDLSVIDYAKLVCALLDIPVHPNKTIESLHSLFTLYAEFKNNAHFAH